VSTLAIEVRILGSLIEKECTTPEQYPLSTNALHLACNQRSNREPVTDYHLLEIEETLRLLADKGLVKSVQGVGERVVKHRHLVADAYGLNRRELSLLGVLMLRGPQTPGELRNRADRCFHFASLAEVEQGLQGLASRQPPLARNNGRGPGQSQDRWSDTFNPDPDRQRPRVRGRGRDPVAQENVSDELARLRGQIAFLYDHLGLEAPDEE